jgi:cytochrome P450
MPNHLPLKRQARYIRVVPVIEQANAPVTQAALHKAFTGPNGHFFRGCFRQMQRDPLGFYTRTQRQYGDYVRFRVVRGIYCHVLTHPDAVEHVLYKSHRNFRKPNVFNKSVSLLMGEGLFTNEGESWISQRRLASPAFQSQFLMKLCPTIVESANAFVRAHENLNGQPIDIAAAMMKLGLRIASTTLFSADISDDADKLGHAFRVTFAHIGSRMNSMHLIPSWLPTPANRAFGQSKRVVDDVVAELIAERRKCPHQPDDLLTMLLASRDETTGQGMSERMLMDEVITLLTAGHENVGSALAWTLYLLAKHPQIQQDVCDEIVGQLGGCAPGFEDVGRLPLLQAVFEESLRLYPPGWGEMRETIAADDINGYAIGPREMIVLCQWVTHRHPDFWPEPERFDPGRFMGTAAKARHRFAFFPFGGGPRICIGMQLAMIEGALVLATILQQFRIELVGDQVVEADATFTLRPRYGVKVILHPR